ncbi:MAG: hypothetical protein HQK50_07590 [Oligoflexia bacterium]|nr:hypothetical protein [Oligoflexia bacterium]MBF0365418.1 hypothetical protein [Oligoflexia bacterium]
MSENDNNNLLFRKVNGVIGVRGTTVADQIQGELELLSLQKKVLHKIRGLVFALIAGLMQGVANVLFYMLVMIAIANTSDGPLYSEIPPKIWVVFSLMMALASEAGAALLLLINAALAKTFSEVKALFGNRKMCMRMLVIATFAGPLAMSGLTLSQYLLQKNLHLSMSTFAGAAAYAGAVLWLRPRERFKLSILYALVLAMMGIFIISYDTHYGTIAATTSVIGVLLMLVYLLGFSMESVGTLMMMELFSPSVIACARYLFSIVGYLVIIVPMLGVAFYSYGQLGNLFLSLSEVLIQKTLGLMVLTAIASSMATLFWYEGISRVGVGLSLPFYLSHPLWGLIISFPLLRSDLNHAYWKPLVVSAAFYAVSFLLVLAFAKDVSPYRQGEKC